MGDSGKKQKNKYNTNSEFIISEKPNDIIKSIDRTDLVCLFIFNCYILIFFKSILKDVVNTAENEEKIIKDNIEKYSKCLFSNKFDINHNLIVCVFSSFSFY